MGSHSDVKKYAAMTFATGASLYFLQKAILSQLSEDAHPIKTEDGVFNYKSLGFMPEGSKGFTYKEPETRFGKIVQGAFYGLMKYLFSVEHSVDFHNARKADVDYEKNGFTLIKSPVEECDWQIKENREKFYKAMEPIIRELHPNVDKMQWYDQAFLARKVDGANPPAVDGPHLDYHIDQSVVLAHAGYDMSAFDIIIGLWKPANMTTPVVDYPLAIMDASTLDADRVVPFFGEIKQETIDKKTHSIKFVSGSVKHADKQKWYYYPNQTADEVILFRHYTNEKRGGPFACAHGSFTEPGAPKNAPSRQSIEMRVCITLKK